MDRKKIRQRAEQLYHENRENSVLEEDLRVGTSHAAIEELQIHQIELSLQNEELARSHVELDDARRRYYRLFDRAPVGYLIVGPTGRVIAVNRRGCELLGADSDTLRADGMLRSLADADSARMLRLLKRAADGEDADGRESDDTVASIVVSNRTLQVAAERHEHNQSDKPEIWVTLTDITAETQAREEAERQAEQIHLLLRELRHRTKNNLQLLLTMVSLQRRTYGREFSDVLQSVEERIRAMVYSHTTMDSAVDRTDLVAMLHSVARHFQNRITATLDFVCTEESIPTSGELALPLALVTNELIANAVKYGVPDTGGGHILVRIQLLGAPGEADHRVRITVLDDGPGFPEDALRNASYNPQDRETVTQATAGGLGFYLVQQFVEEQMGGTWRRVNPPDGGAEHIVEVPLEDSPDTHTYNTYAGRST